VAVGLASLPLSPDAKFRTTTDDLARLATEALVESKHWPTNWCVEMTEESMNYDGQPPFFRCWSADGRDGGTEEMSLGSEDYDDELATYIATMNTREPLLAAGILDLTRQLAEARSALVEACRVLELRADPLWPDYDEEIARIAELKAKGGV